MSEALFSLSIAEEISLAIAPVFLLTAIMTLLTLLSQRLARCVDRIRADDATVEVRSTLVRDRIGRDLRRRLRLLQWSVRLAVLSALLICVVVILIFMHELVFPDLSLLIAGLFVGSMALLIASLLMVLVDVSVSVSSASVAAWD